MVFFLALKQELCNNVKAQREKQATQGAAFVFLYLQQVGRLRQNTFNHRQRVSMSGKPETTNMRCDYVRVRQPSPVQRDGY